MTTIISKQSLLTCLLVGLTACSSEVDLPDDLPGSDRDAQGCIPSAGYTWSVIRKYCIRIWEDGIELTHQGSGDPNFSAYALTNEEQAELFLPEQEGSVVLSRNMTVPALQTWSEDGIDYVLTFDAYQAMVLTDRSGFVMYRDESVQSDGPGFVEHAADDLGGAIKSATGLVTQVEDGAYPMFTVYIRLDSEETVTPFSLMSEGAAIVGARIDQMESRRVNVEYVDLESWELVTIYRMGSEPEDDSEVNDGWRFVTGRLTGADVISGGDLPDTLSIETSSGETVEFDEFIDQTLVSLNGNDISAWLAPRSYKDIVTLKVVK